MDINQLLNKHSSRFYPVFIPELNKTNTLIMDFSESNDTIKSINIEDTVGLEQYISDLIKSGGYIYGYGGYMENRDVYKRSPLFVDGNDHRTIHLGVDIWTPPNYPFYFPLEGKIHSFKNNNNFGDYGPTIIVEHELEGVIFYILYGHLTLNSIKHLSVGQTVKAGEKGGFVGNSTENGSWPPHLHFQVITDMMGNIGDFPGTTSKNSLDKYRKICPDPKYFF